MKLSELNEKKREYFEAEITEAINTRLKARPAIKKLLDANFNVFFEEEAEVLFKNVYETQEMVAWIQAPTTGRDMGQFLDGLIDFYSERRDFNIPEESRGTASALAAEWRTDSARVLLRVLYKYLKAFIEMEAKATP